MESEPDSISLESVHGLTKIFEKIFFYPFLSKEASTVSFSDFKDLKLINDAPTDIVF